MSSSRSEYEDEILERLGKDPTILALLGTIPEKVADTVRSYVPIDTGRTKASISVTSRTTALRRLTTRRTKLGKVYSDDPDQKRIAAIEYGRGDGDEHGGTPAHHPFLKAAIAWEYEDL